MCGIVCYLGKRKKSNFLIEKLKKLEYRGYDSAGITNLSNGIFHTKKSVGNISNLEKIITNEDEVSCALSHTRWATHGECNILNTHPHFSENKIWSVVHNGIIENYLELINGLKNKPKSSTDTVVIAEILEENDVKNIEDFSKVLKSLKGSYALVAISSELNNTLFFAKQKSPMFISRNDENDYIIASDPICFDGFSENFIIVEDGEYGFIKDKTLHIFSQNGEEIKKKVQKNEIDFNYSEKGDYEHFMLKEIFEEPQCLTQQVEDYKGRNILHNFSSNFLHKFDKIIFVGCGTAYHAGLIGAKYAKNIAKINSYAISSGEFLSEDELFIDEKTLCFFISQSGETADTLHALEIAKIFGATTLALTNVMYSSICRKADYVLPTCAGTEIAVASTKAFVCQLSALYLFFKNAISFNFYENYDFFSEILEIKNKILQFNKEQIKSLAKEICLKNECVFIGLGIDYVTACESSLKLKEVSYINSACYPSSELKHGYLAMIENGVIVIAFACSKKTNSRTYNSAEEAKARGARVIMVTTDEEYVGNETILIEASNEFLAPILCSSIMQYMAYEVSISKGINPDKPRNLAKSVTVE